MRPALHADPAVRSALPGLGNTLRFLAAAWVVTVVAVVATLVWAGDRFAVLATLLPVGCLLFLANRLAIRLDDSLARFWRVLSIGLALVALTFVTIGLREVIEPDVLFVALGLLAPSAIFFLTYGMWIRLQASTERSSSLGFFDVVLVVAVGLAYVSFLLTSDVFIGAGQGFGIGVFILVSCVVILLMTVMLVGRRQREPGEGIGVEVMFALVLGLSVAAVAAMFAWDFVSNRELLDVPSWILGPAWTLVFTIAALTPYAEDTRRGRVFDDVGGVRPFWPYLLLALTPPIAVGALMTTQEQQKVAGIVGLLLVVEVLVVRQLVLIAEQRRSRFRQHRLRDLAATEAGRTTVILDLALALAGLDDPRAMCDAVAAAVAALEEDAAVAVFGRCDGAVVAASRGVDDPATMYATLRQLRLTSSRCVRLSGSWVGVAPQLDALVAAVMGAAGDRLGYVVVVLAGPGGEERPDLADSIGGVADQLALALDRAGLLDAVRADAARVRESVDRLSEGVGVVGPDDRVSACNEAFARLIGLSADDVVGAPLPPRLLARLPIGAGRGGEISGEGSWTSEVDLGIGDEALPMRVSVFLSPTDPLDDGVVVVIGEVTPAPGERERLAALLDDLTRADAPDGPGPNRRESVIARRLALGLRDKVQVPIAGVQAALAADAVAETASLVAAAEGAKSALRAIYTEAAREVRG